MLRASILNDNFDVEPSGEGFTVNGKFFQWDIAKIADGYFHILYAGKGYTAEVVKTDFQSKSFHVKINGVIYPVQVKDKFDLLLEKVGMSSTTSGKLNLIKAPMPGLIIDLKVKTGDVVKAGDPLLILEAMKMENILKAPGEGEVKSVKVKKGDSVEKNQVLIEF